MSIPLIWPLIKMDGAGQIDLGKEKIDMRLNPLVVLSTSGQSSNFDLDEFGIPVLIEGPLDNPRIYPDLKELLKNPQATLDMLSKLGINIDGLVNSAKVPDNNIIGNLISKITPVEGTSKNSGAENIVKSLIGQLVKSGVNQSIEGTNSASQLPNDDIDSAATGRIPIPTLSPRRNAAVSAKSETIKEQIIDQVERKLDLPIDDDITKKALKGLFDNLLQ